MYALQNNTLDLHCGLKWYLKSPEEKARWWSWAQSVQFTNQSIWRKGIIYNLRKQFGPQKEVYVLRKSFNMNYGINSLENKDWINDPSGIGGRNWLFHPSVMRLTWQDSHQDNSCLPPQPHFLFVNRVGHGELEAAAMPFRIFSSWADLKGTSLAASPIQN